MENLTERPGQPKFRTDSYSSLTQLTAWGVPALQTVAVLVSRFVDADELLGKWKKLLLRVEQILDEKPCHL